MPPIDVLRIDDKSLDEAFRRADRARDLALDAFRHRFPMGATIRWVRNGGVQHGQVVRHGYGGRVEVRNVETDAVYWITAGDVLEAIRGQ